MFTRGLLTLVLAVLALPAPADGDESPWSGKATLGYLATSGNSENLNLNAGFEVVSYTVKHNTGVLPFTEKTDTCAALSLEYLF